MASFALLYIAEKVSFCNYSDLSYFCFFAWSLLYVNLEPPVEVKSGRIASVVSDDFEVGQLIGKHVVDFGHAVVMPGLVDM